MLCRFAGRLTYETIIRKPAIPTPSPIGQSVSERCLDRQKRPAGVPFGNACRAGVGYSESSSSVISSRDRTMRVGVTGPRSASSRVASPVSTRMEVASVPWARAMSVYSLSPTTAQLRRGEAGFLRQEVQGVPGGLAVKFWEDAGGRLDQAGDGSAVGHKAAALHRAVQIGIDPHIGHAARMKSQARRSLSYCRVVSKPSTTTSGASLSTVKPAARKSSCR